MSSYLCSTPEERQAMLEVLGMKSMDDLYVDVPEEVMICLLYTSEKRVEHLRHADRKPRQSGLAVCARSYYDGGELPPAAWIKRYKGETTMELTREQGLALLRTYNQEPFHLRHAFTVEAVMDWYARTLEMCIRDRPHTPPGRRYGPRGGICCTR